MAKSDVFFCELVLNTFFYYNNAALKKNSSAVARTSFTNFAIMVNNCAQFECNRMKFIRLFYFEPNLVENFAIQSVTDVTMFKSCVNSQNSTLLFLLLNQKFGSGPP